VQEHGTLTAHTVLVKRGHSILVAAALAVGIVAGWGVGAARGTCEHTCPARGPCPTPLDCLNPPFNWTAAIVLGLVVTAIIVAVGVAMLNRTGRD
jgi:hypothetical protein